MPKKIVKKQEDLELKNNKERDNVYNSFNNEQKSMFESIHKNIFTYCEAKAGTGKTLVTVAAMVNLLADNKISKIIYIQKPSERYLSQGYLPGTMDEKEQFLFTPLYDALTTLGLFDSKIQFMLDKGMLELKSDSALRGVNFKNAGIIIDECVDGKSRIDTESGNYKVYTLYNMYKNNRELPKVLTINETTKNLEYKDIISVSYKGEKPTIEIKASNKKIRCTTNHPFLTVDGWKQAGDLVVGDILVASNRNSNQMPFMLNKDQEQILIGSYLGDGSFTYQGINKYACKFVQGEKQLDYLKWKSSIFNCENTIRSQSSGYSKNSVVFSSRINTFVSKLGLKTNVGRKNIHIPQNIIDAIDARAISIWFMDDGSLSKKQNSSSIWCCAFDLDSIERLCDKLNEFGIYPVISTSKGFNYLRMDKSNTEKLSELICKYVPKCMEYKIIDKYKSVEKYVWDNNISNLGYTVVTKITYDNKIIPVYDLEIEDNHNFCIVSSRVPVSINTPGIFVHNCENIDYHTLKLIFTRCDDECHVCMIGDSKQKDNHRNNKDFIPYGDYLASFSFGNKITLTKNYRGKFSKTAEDFTLED